MTFELIQRRLSDTANRFPNRIAVEHGDGSLTFREVEARSNRVANFLLAGGNQKGTIVVVFLDERVDVLISVLGLLKAGHVFAPFEPAFPDKRLRSMFSDASPRLVITERSHVPRLRMLLDSASRDAELLCLEGADPGMSQDFSLFSDSHCPLVEQRPDDFCYLYYTSGSTGRPKGIMGRLGSVSHYIDWEIRTFGVDEDARVSQLTSPSYDAYLRDILTPLCAGGRVCIPNWDHPASAPGCLARWVDARGITLLHCVPSLFRSLLADSRDVGLYKNLKFILMAGEAIPTGDVRQWMAIFGERVQLVNLYGPSETTMTKFVHFIRPSDGELRSIPIGRPMEGAKAILISPTGKATPAGAIGEICIRTPYRSLGYYRQPELRARKKLSVTNEGGEGMIRE